MSTPIGPLLRDLAAEVPEPDLAETAWVEARRRARRRRRTTLGVLAGAAAAAVIAVTVSHLGSFGAAAPVPGHRGVTAYQPEHSAVDGTPVDQAPTPLQEPELPLLSSIRDVALPERLGFAADAALARLSDLGGVEEPVRAVLLRHDGTGGFLPVLYLPDRASGPYVEVDSVRLVPLTDADGYSFPYLGTSTISDDRGWLAFVQPGKVIALDVRTGLSRAWTVPDTHLVSGGWARDQRHIIVSGAARTWQVDTDTGAVVEVGAAFPGRARLVSVPSRGPALQTSRADGSTADTRDVPDLGDGWWGEPVTNLEGWTVQGDFYSQRTQALSTSYQGLYAVQFDVHAHARLLAAPDVPGVSKGAFAARGWAPQDVVLFSSTSYAEPGSATTIRLLAWSVVDGRLWRVSDVGPVTSGAGGFTGDFALSP